MTPLTVTKKPRTVVSKGRLQVVLDHHGEAAEQLFVVVRIDCGLFGQRVQFFLAQFRHERKPRRKAAVIAPFRCALRAPGDENGVRALPADVGSPWLRETVH